MALSAVLRQRTECRVFAHSSDRRKCPECFQYGARGWGDCRPGHSSAKVLNGVDTQFLAPDKTCTKTAPGSDLVPHSSPRQPQQQPRQAIDPPGSTTTWCNRRDLISQVLNIVASLPYSLHCIRLRSSKNLSSGACRSVSSLMLCSSNAMNDAGFVPDDRLRGP
jgi:hypothetical protein